MIKAYLDIDGVLLTRKHNLPEHIEEFIDFMLSHFDCYWLTTHCRNGENRVINYLSQF